MTVLPEVEPDAAENHAPEIDPSAPAGPSAEEEAEYLTREAEHGQPTPIALSPEPDENELGGQLPKLDELSQRISPEVIGMMDELFRTKFTKVQRVSAQHLKKS